MRPVRLCFALLCLTACETSTGLDAGPFDAGPRRVDAGGVDSGPPLDAGDMLEDVKIYAHSRDVLFEFSPFTNTVTELGAFQLAGGDEVNMLDLAVNADGDILTVGFEEIFTVNPETLETVPVMTYREEFDSDVAPLFALSFIAPGQSPTGEEILVGATNSGELYEIDIGGDQLTPRGRYPDNWGSSGDITSIDGLGIFATIRERDMDGRPIEGQPDAIAEITIPASGDATVRVIGQTRTPIGETFTALFGLGYWGRNLYGFSSDGELLRIDRSNGITELVSASTGANQFFGAGVTTQVPFLF